MEIKNLYDEENQDLNHNLRALEILWSRCGNDGKNGNTKRSPLKDECPTPRMAFYAGVLSMEAPRRHQGRAESHTGAFNKDVFRYQAVSAKK